MRIQPINLYNNINTNPLRKQQPELKASTPDMFVKSPSFGSHTKLMPFFEGGIEYTTENLKKFNSILKNINLSDGILKTLIDKAKPIPRNIKFEQDFTFNYDFLIRYADADEILDAGLGSYICDKIHKIRFSSKDLSKVDSILDRSLNDHQSDGKVRLCDITDSALKEENLNLLKILSKNNGQYFKKFLLYKDWQNEEIVSFIENGRESKNPVIRDLFSGKNLYNLLKDFYKDVRYDIENMVNAEFISAMPPSGQRNYYINDFFDDNASPDCRFIYNKETLAMSPISDQEREILLDENMFDDEDDQIEVKQQVLKLMEKRINNIVHKNGLETPKNLLNCLKDGIMSEEMLTQKYQDTTLIEEIAKMPYNKEIMDELSKYSHLKDNESYRNAAITAANQGNTELLKFLDSRHIHYANNLKDPIEAYPKEIQEILKNAKVSDTKIFEYANSPKKLIRFLENNPRVDINTLNDEGKTLLLVSAINQDLDMFQYLANRNDVDLNMVDNYGKNVLMQIVSSSDKTIDSSFAKKAIEILRNQPSERFDINYVNYTPGLTGISRSYSVLTGILHYGLREDLIEEILKFPTLDTNFNPMSEMPLPLTVIDTPKDFEQIFFHPNTDLEGILAYCNPDNSTSSDINKDVLETLSSYIAKKCLVDVKKRYDENGFLTLDEIEKLVNSDDKKKHFCHEKINIVGENIGHLLAETVVDEDNTQEMKQLRSIFRKLQKCGYNFNSKDDFGVTPLAKAIECQNEPLEDMFRLFGDED